MTLFRQPIQPFFDTPYRLWLSDGDLEASNAISAILESGFLTAALRHSLDDGKDAASVAETLLDDIRSFLMALAGYMKSALPSINDDMSYTKVSL